MNKQECAIKYITENYLEYNRLRHDIVSDKLQIRMAVDLESSESCRMVQNGVESSSAENTMLHNATQPLHNSTQHHWREMTKHDINSIVCHAAQEYDANITSREVMTALQSDLIPQVHPLREYILSLHPWGGKVDWIDFVAQQVHVKNNNAECGINKDNLNNLCARPTLALAKEDISPLSQQQSVSSPLSNVGEAEELSMLSSEQTNPLSLQDSPADRLWRLCFKKWFVAMVASWMKDEVVNHQVLVLIGRQGIFKTTWLEHLIPPHLRAYACKLANSNDLNKDERLRIAEFGLISLDEIDSMNNRELNQLKSIITSSDVNERAAYAYTKERRVRLASFCASGNRRDFLTDITGNRRWLPFEVESIQNPFYTIMPYKQMYAQAWALAQDPNFNYWFELDEIDVLEQHNLQFRDESNEEQLLPILFDVPAEGRGEFMTTAQISERLVTYGNIKKPMALSRLGMVLGTAGFKAAKRKIGNIQTRGWIVYQRDTDEISALRRILKD